jgi:hypothetical protein
VAHWPSHGRVPRALQIGYLDRLLQLVVVPNNRLQLVALCCIVIAGKGVLSAVL